MERGIFLIGIANSCFCLHFFLSVSVKCMDISTVQHVFIFSMYPVASDESDLYFLILIFGPRKPFGLLHVNVGWIESELH